SGRLPSGRDPNDVIGNTIHFSKQFLQRYFLAWYWGAYILLSFFGLNLAVSLVIATVCMGLSCLMIGLVRALDELSKAEASLGSNHQHPPIAGAAVGHPSLPHSWNSRVSLPPPPSVAAINSEPFVGNLVLGIFHLAHCDWVDHISTKNRVGFYSASEAVSHGFKPCQICSPAA